VIDPAHAAALRALVHAQRIAALGTLHEGEPQVSMVPFALVRSARFVIHVSALAAHTKDMQADARVSLMIAGQPDAQTPPQAVPRVTIQGDASRLDDDALHEDARRAYLARFPESEPMFGFGDFSLFVITPRSARFVGGFAQAKTITPESLAQALD
jgi:putative heme iron utilization protein